MRIEIVAPKRRSDAARVLADRRYHHRVARNKKTYSRKGRISSKKFEDSFQLANGRGLIEMEACHTHRIRTVPYRPLGVLRGIHGRHVSALRSVAVRLAFAGLVVGQLRRRHRRMPLRLVHLSSPPVTPGVIFYGTDNV